MDEVMKNNIIQFAKKLEGKTVSLENAADNLMFIKESKRLAKEHDWLYHCTTDVALLSILQNREFWLSNLKLVNDKEEVERVDIAEYEKTYYVCCFTYDPEIPKEHWEEYGNIENGVLIGVKPEWVRREAVFMSSDNQKSISEYDIILKNEKEALEYKITHQQNGRITNPFYVNAFGFYQIIYDDELIKNITGNSMMQIGDMVLGGRSITPEVAGIIKSKKGICTRWGKEPYEKDWTTEKEVRLKVGIQQFDIFKNEHESHDGMIMQEPFFPKVAVPLVEDAFREIRIKFSPSFKDKDVFIEKIKTLLPESIVEVI